MRSGRRSRAILAFAIVALASACGGGRPSGQGVGPAASTLPIGLPTATFAADATLPIMTEAPATPVTAASVEPSSPPISLPTQAPHPSILPSGSLILKMTAPVEVDVEVPAAVDCTAGGSYHMDTGVTVDGYGFVVVVEIARYHGADSYRATVTVEVTVDGDKDGGTIPGVPVTIKSDTKGFVEFDYSGGSTPVTGKITWTCST